jgi:ArsR family transcriptional regulator, arsenate/arsenite/antimonite-responsive transcriptional repressor / arsenate reductase (thioredoxin)
MDIEASRTRTVEERANVHGALADPTRLAIVDELTSSDRTPSELGRSLAIPSNLLAHHLGILEQRGVVERRRSIGDGRRAYMHLLIESLDGLAIRPIWLTDSIFFVCTQNSARSQLAAAMWNRSHPSVRAESAGTHPNRQVHPRAVRAARRRGLDLSSTVPQLFDPLTTQEALIVTVCDQAREELDDRVSIHWSVRDPAVVGKDSAFEAAADEIARRVERLSGTVERSGAIV